jgi:ABC-2 type transport system ATP-binding protein
VIQKTGLSQVSERLIGNLSKGYQQRVGIAQALVHSPEIIILDEPTVGLDPSAINEIRELIKELKKDPSLKARLDVGDELSKELMLAR